MDALQFFFLRQVVIMMASFFCIDVHLIRSALQMLAAFTIAVSVLGNTPLLSCAATQMRWYKYLLLEKREEEGEEEEANEMRDT